jgi:hypothetical protein
MQRIAASAGKRPVLPTPAEAPRLSIRSRCICDRKSAAHVERIQTNSDTQGIHQVALCRNNRLKTFLRTMAVMVVLGAGAQADSITQTVNFQYRTVAKEQDTHDTASPRPHKRSAVNSRSPAHLGEILSLRSRRHCRRRFGSPGRRRRSHFRSRSFGFKRGRAPREPRRPELLAVLGGSASTDRDRRRSPHA